MPSSFVATLALFVAVSASAQERRPHRVELDGLIGYTAVNVDEWAELGRADDMSHLAGGVVIRGLLFNVGTTHVGLEIGTQRLFSYTARRETTNQIITEKATVAGFHILVIGRFVELDRYSWDGGFGWYALGDAAVPGLVTNLNYVVLRNSRFSIPVGARLNIVLNEPAIAATVIAKIGVSMPLSRQTHAPASR